MQPTSLLALSLLATVCKCAEGTGQEASPTTTTTTTTTTTIPTEDAVVPATPASLIMDAGWTAWGYVASLWTKQIETRENKKMGIERARREGETMKIVTGTGAIVEVTKDEDFDEEWVLPAGYGGGATGVLFRGIDTVVNAVDDVSSIIGSSFTPLIEIARYLDSVFGSATGFIERRKAIMMEKYEEVGADGVATLLHRLYTLYNTGEIVAKIFTAAGGDASVLEIEGLSGPKVLFCLLELEDVKKNVEERFPTELKGMEDMIPIPLTKEDKEWWADWNVTLKAMKEQGKQFREAEKKRRAEWSEAGKEHGNVALPAPRTSPNRLQPKQQLMLADRPFNTEGAEIMGGLKAAQQESKSKVAVPVTPKEEKSTTGPTYTVEEPDTK